MESTTDRWTEIREAHHENPFVYQIMGGAALVALGILLGAAIFAQDEGYATNLYTEILSIGVTVFILNTLAERRQEKRQEQHEEQTLKERLIRDAGSMSNHIAVHAIKELRERKWLEGENSLLIGADLRLTNLSDAKLWNANFQNANLWGAKFENTDLINSNLENANIGGARFSGSDMKHANLTGTTSREPNTEGIREYRAIVYLDNTNLFDANLQNSKLAGVSLRNSKLLWADLEKAYLISADLRDTVLLGANLKWASLFRTEFDENTILPDGTHWTPETDISRFTDPNHPNFWRSNDKYSPAYRGDDPDPQ